MRVGAASDADRIQRFNQALVNNEVAESSNKILALELQEARTAVGRLSGEHARSVGWETRLRVALQERDDLQQERDNEAARARQAETRVVVFADKCGQWMHTLVFRALTQPSQAQGPGSPPPRRP